MDKNKPLFTLTPCPPLFKNIKQKVYGKPWFRPEPFWGQSTDYPVFSIRLNNLCNIFIYIFLAAYSVLATHLFAYVAHFVFLRDVWVRTQRAAVAISCATNLATHLPNLATHLPA
jgi:hypothetical protein